MNHKIDFVDLIDTVNVMIASNLAEGKIELKNPNIIHSYRLETDIRKLQVVFVSDEDEFYHGRWVLKRIELTKAFDIFKMFGKRFEAFGNLTYTVSGCEQMFLFGAMQFAVRIFQVKK